MSALLPMTAPFDPTAQALDEAAWVHEAAVGRIATPADIVRWADAKIMAIDVPPYWLIELSTLKSRDPQDYAKVIEPELSGRLDTDSKVSLIAAAVGQGHIDLGKAMGELWRIWMPPGCPERGETLPADLADLLMVLDYYEDGDPRWDDELSRLRAALADHLARHPGPPSSIYHLPSPISSC